MKIIKHELTTFYKGKQQYKKLCDTKAEALKRESKSEFFSRKYTGEVVIDLHCDYCEKDLKPGDEYLKVDEDERYCEDCYEEHSVTYYSVGGENVGYDDNSEVYDEWDREAEEVSK